MKARLIIELPHLGREGGIKNINILVFKDQKF